MGENRRHFNCQVPGRSRVDTYPLLPPEPNTSMLHWSFSWSELAEQQNHGKTTLWKRKLAGTEFLLGLWAYVFNSGSHGQKMAFLSTPPPRLRKSKGGVHNEERSI